MTWLVFVAAWALALAVHEASHAAAARYLGVEVEAVVLAGGAGFVVYAGDAHAAPVVRAVALAGPGANLAVAAAGFAVALSTTGAVRLIAAAAAIHQAVQGVANLVPVGSTDGALAWRAHRAR